MKLSVVIPFYNEAKNVPLVLEEFKKLSEIYTDFELLCVNDGSKDQTAETFNTLLNTGAYPFAKFITYSPNQGYGYAIMTGVRSASGELIAWTHSDLQTPTADVFKAREIFLDSQDKKILVKGWRVNRTLQQIILSFGMAVIASVLLRRKLTEINAQPKLFPRSMVELLNNAPKDFSLDLYLLCMAQNHNYQIKTFNVSFENRIHGQSSWATSWKTKYNTIWRSIKYIWKLKNSI